MEDCGGDEDVMEVMKQTVENNKPVHVMSDMLSPVAADQVDCIFVYPFNFDSQFL